MLADLKASWTLQTRRLTLRRCILYRLRHIGPEKLLGPFFFFDSRVVAGQCRYIQKLIEGRLRVGFHFCVLTLDARKVGARYCRLRDSTYRLEIPLLGSRAPNPRQAAIDQVELRSSFRSGPPSEVNGRWFPFSEVVTQVACYHPPSATTLGTVAGKWTRQSSELNRGRLGSYTSRSFFLGVQLPRLALTGWSRSPKLESWSAECDPHNYRPFENVLSWG
ncbi:hypothetical protein BDW68DRAFT_85416 [Aspergillus falconensis]